MDRTRANKNVSTGFIVMGLALLIFALTFYFAVLFIG